MSEQQHSFSDAPLSVQIAVDLIELLEENKVDTDIAIEALQIVLADFEKKNSQK